MFSSGVKKLDGTKAGQKPYTFGNLHKSSQKENDLTLR
ncbi:hypothetical protein M899_3237 [Bacteriovorax sp. BSW11_IV]|nr:hypothetical protein M899_3237 [Bacteriovorax sp. BSW11_IV]